ncbi:MAG: GDSL-type esterase/lipase family protein [Eubacteriales bacterium]|nr:GDSL-type esterase/lipase family protein [Eubacteriales bacterium]
MKRLLCLGDSITDCNHLFSPSPYGDGYVRLLADELGADADLQVLNRGIDGFTVQRLLDHSDEYLACNADVITILIGINDIGVMMNTNRTKLQQQTLLAEFCEKYKCLLSRLASQQTSIVLMGPFIFPWPAFYQHWIPHTEAMSDLIKELADCFQLPFLPLQKRFQKELERHSVSELTTDGIHLTPLGHQLLAGWLLPLLKPR